MYGGNERGVSSDEKGTLQETWTSVSEGGVRCSKALVDMYTALCSVAEENAAVAGAHIAYAALLEKALSKIALQHVVSLEKLCQVRQACPSACATG